MNKNNEGHLWDFIEGFCNSVMENFDFRWAQIKPELFDKYIHEAVGGLLARQATLAIELAQAPMIWNINTAPLILRSMVDAHINIAWITKNLDDRAKKYIEYGLGQEKLNIEYLEEALREKQEHLDNEVLRDTIQYRKHWLNAQLAEWATIVNVGSWSGISTRDMAKDVGLESFYKLSFVPSSGVAHNMWQHVGIYNVCPCTNPLHNQHLIPIISKAPNDPEFLLEAAKYISMSFELIDKKMNIKSEKELPVNFFLNHPIFKEQVKS